MTDERPIDPDAPLPAISAVPSMFWAFIRQGLTILLATTAFAWLLRLLIERDPVRGAWTLQVMLAIAALLASIWDAYYRRQFWQKPLRRLMVLLPKIREGEAAIDELSPLPGGLEPLVPILQGILRDLRLQKQAVAELECEIRQRVATRTDALERTIGSLRQQATRDALTGLFNRRFMDQYLPQAIQRAQTRNTDLCLLMIDVDNFKILNDTLGHAAGDELLKSIGQIIRSTVRGEDVAFRCGGDEFIVLLPGADSRAGKSLSDRLISLVDGLARTIRGVQVPPRLSIGSATLSNLSSPTLENLVAEADRQLYAIKGERHAKDGQYRGRPVPARIAS